MPSVCLPYITNKPALIFIDNAAAHIGTKLIDICYLLFSPPNMTEKMQPSDNGIFSVIMDNYDVAIKNTGRGRIINGKSILKSFDTSYNLGISSNFIRDYFKKTCIFPFSPEGLKFKKIINKIKEVNSIDSFKKSFTVR